MANLTRRNQKLTAENENMKAKDTNLDMEMETFKKNMELTISNLEFKNWIWILSLGVALILFVSVLSLTCYLLLKLRKKKVVKKDQKEELPMSEIPENKTIQSEDPDAEAGPYVNRVENYYYVDKEAENDIYEGEEEEAEYC